MTEFRLDPEVDSLIEPLRGISLSDWVTQASSSDGHPLGEFRSQVVEEPAVVTAPGVDCADADIPGRPAVRVRRYEPAESHGGLAPAALWCHGGGWVGGDLDMPEAHAVAQRMCTRLSAVVYSVAYRLAPEHRFPEPVDDIVTVLRHLTLGSDSAVDPERIVVGGASAGAHLVACALHAWRRENLPGPAAAFLAYPGVDPVDGPLGEERPGVCPELLWFDRATVAGLFFLHAGADETEARPLLLDPSGLPPTLVTSIPADALAPQAAAYVDHLRAHGVEATEHVVDGVLHGYLNMVGQAAVADAALGRHLDWVAERLAAPPG